MAAESQSGPITVPTAQFIKSVDDFLAGGAAIQVSSQDCLLLCGSQAGFDLQGGAQKPQYRH